VLKLVLMPDDARLLDCRVLVIIHMHTSHLSDTACGSAVTGLLVPVCRASGWRGPLLNVRARWPLRVRMLLRIPIAPPQVVHINSNIEPVNSRAFEGQVEGQSRCWSYAPRPSAKVGTSHARSKISPAMTAVAPACSGTARSAHPGRCPV
jgi:hypothetical protein